MAEWQQARLVILDGLRGLPTDAAAHRISIDRGAVCMVQWLSIGNDTQRGRLHLNLSHWPVTERRNHPSPLSTSTTLERGTPCLDWPYTFSARPT